MRVEPSPTPPDDLEDAVAVFLHHRGRLFGIARRVLGSTVEAEDVVQEVWLRWQRTDRSVVLSPAAFLSSATTRLAINVAQSARVRRETYIGPWLPELVDTGADPAVGAERAEAVERALLVVLERLTPVERAAYVLREAFDYAYAEIAELLEVSLANVRKIVSRARRHLLDDRRASVDAAEHRRLLDTFVAAAGTGDVARLEALLASDVVGPSDASVSAAAPKHRAHQVLWVFTPGRIGAFADSRSRFAVAPGRRVSHVRRLPGHTEQNRTFPLDCRTR